MTNDYYDAMEDFNLLSEGEQVSLLDLEDDDFFRVFA